MEEEWGDEDSTDAEMEVPEGGMDVTSTAKPKKSVDSRSSAARADASVATIRKNIESVYGLPEGSVELCNRQGKPMRGDATIATLRKRWE